MTKTPQVDKFSPSGIPQHPIEDLLGSFLKLGTKPKEESKDQPKEEKKTSS